MLHMPGTRSTRQTTLPLPCGGQALVFSDATLLLADASGRVFPAPFRHLSTTPPKPSVLSQRLATLSPWPQEWSAGAPAGRLAPAYRPFVTVVCPSDEDLLVALGEHLLVLAKASGARLEWQSQPVTRTGTLTPPSVTLRGVRTPTHLIHHDDPAPTDPHDRIAAMLAHLWAQGYPIPALPGQSLRDGEVRPVASGIYAHAPLMDSAHQQLRLAKQPELRALRAQLATILEPA